MENTARSVKFRSREYLEDLFSLAEGLVLDARDRAELGKRYEQALEWSGLEQKALAKQVGVGDRQIRNYLDGKVNNAAGPARAWADATGVRYQWLLTGEGDPFPLDDAGRLARMEKLLEALLVEVQALVREQPSDDESRAGEQSEPTPN